MKIFKYAISPVIGYVDMPRGAKILHVGTKGDQTCIWALVDDAAPTERRAINVIGTGWDMLEDPGEHIGTVMQGAFVWHIFDGGMAR